jgi:hypothetical protein
MKQLMSIGYQPIDDPKADELRNPNLNEPTAEDGSPIDYPNTESEATPEGQSQNIDEDPSSLMDIGYEILDMFTNDTG